MAQFLCGDGFLLPDLATEPQVVRKNRSAGVSPASEPRQLLLGQHDLCRLEAGDTFFLTTTETRRSLRVSVAEDLTVKNHKVLLTNAAYPWLFEREVRNAPKEAACRILALIRKDPSAGFTRRRGADEEGLDSVHG